MNEFVIYNQSINQSTNQRILKKINVELEPDKTSLNNSLTEHTTQMNWISAFGNKTHRLRHINVSTRTVKSLNGHKNLHSVLRNEIIHQMFFARDQWGAQIPITSGPFMRWIRSQDSAVTRMWARRCWVLFPAGVGIRSLLQTVQTGYGGHPNSYSVGTWGSFVGDKAAVACTWPPISISFRIKNTWSCNPSPPIRRYGVNRNKFTFLVFVRCIYGWINMTTSTKMIHMWEVHVSNPDPGTGYKKIYLISQFLSVPSFNSRSIDVTTVFLLIFAYSLFTNCSVF